jgi:Cu+-exporting ATPase
LSSGRVTTVVLDKTGTLTTGRMTVASITVVGGVDEHELLGLAAAIEAASEHPIARAIVDEADRRSIVVAGVEQFVALPGLGATGRVHGRPLVVGNPRLIESSGATIPAPMRAAISAADELGQTVVGVAHDGLAIGLVVLEDRIRPDARAAVRRLVRLGLEPVLLTGDRLGAARRCADELGIDTVFAGATPVEKADIVRSLRERGGTVAMVGDGINDAVALATADLGLGIAEGTDIALKAADIILVRTDLAAVPDAIELSRRTLRIIRQNLLWAFGYNVAAIPIAAAGLLNPLIAAAAMSLSSLVVVYNSLRLQNFTPSR